MAGTRRVSMAGQSRHWRLTVSVPAVHINQLDETRHRMTLALADGTEPLRFGRPFDGRILRHELFEVLIADVADDPKLFNRIAKRFVSQ